MLLENNVENLTRQGTPKLLNSALRNGVFPPAKRGVRSDKVTGRLLVERTRPLSVTWNRKMTFPSVSEALD